MSGRSFLYRIVTAGLGLALAATPAPALAEQAGDLPSVAESAENSRLEISVGGESSIKTLSEAVQIAGRAACKIVLYDDFDESVAIPAGADIQIDLNGHHITYGGSLDTIFVEAPKVGSYDQSTLYINDSSESGTGYIENTSPEYGGKTFSAVTVAPELIGDTGKGVTLDIGTDVRKSGSGPAVSWESTSGSLTGEGRIDAEGVVLTFTGDGSQAVMFGGLTCHSSADYALTNDGMGVSSPTGFTAQSDAGRAVRNTGTMKIARAQIAGDVENAADGSGSLGAYAKNSLLELLGGTMVEGSVSNSYSNAAAASETDAATLRLTQTGADDAPVKIAGTITDLVDGKAAAGTAGEHAVVDIATDNAVFKDRSADAFIKAGASGEQRGLLKADADGWMHVGDLEFSAGASSNVIDVSKGELTSASLAAVLGIQSNWALFDVAGQVTVDDASLTAVNKAIATVKASGTIVNDVQVPVAVTVRAKGVDRKVDGVSVTVHDDRVLPSSDQGKGGSGKQGGAMDAPKDGGGKLAKTGDGAAAEALAASVLGVTAIAGSVMTSRRRRA